MMVGRSLPYYSLLVLLLGHFVFTTIELWPEDCWTFDIQKLADAPPGFTCQSASFDSLDEKGFAVFPGFLPPDLLDQLRARVDSLPWEYSIFDRERNHKQIFLRKKVNFSGLESPDPDLQEFQRRLRAFFEDIRARTRSRVADPLNFAGQISFTFLNESVDGTGWHKDDPPYMMGHDVASEYTLAIMLRKTYRDSGGLSFVGLDSLRRLPAGFASSYRQAGAVVFTEARGLTLLQDRTSDCGYVLGTTLSDMACSPESGPGDLVVFRADLVHRTQARHRGLREALYIRAEGPASAVRAFQGGLLQYMHLLFNEDKAGGYREDGERLLPEEYPALSALLGPRILWPCLCYAGYAWRQLAFPLRLLAEALLHGFAQAEVALMWTRLNAQDFCRMVTSGDCGKEVEFSPPPLRDVAE